MPFNSYFLSSTLYSQRKLGRRWRFVQVHTVSREAEFSCFSFNSGLLLNDNTSTNNNNHIYTKDITLWDHITQNLRLKSTRFLKEFILFLVLIYKSSFILNITQYFKFLYVKKPEIATWEVKCLQILLGYKELYYLGDCFLRKPSSCSLQQNLINLQLLLKWNIFFNLKALWPTD